MIKLFKRKLLPVMLTFIIAFLCVPIYCKAEENTANSKVLKVGLYYTGESKDIEALKEAHAYDIEYLQAISQYTDWTYEYYAASWEECLSALQSGKIDILGFVQETDEREQSIAFSSLPMAVISGFLVTGSQNSVSEVTEKLKSGIQIGVCKENAFNEEFKTYCEDYDYNINYVEYNSFDELSPALERGEIEAAVLAENDLTKTEQIVGNFSTVNQYFATNKDNTALLHEINNAMKLVNTYCPNLNFDLYKRYIAQNANGKPIFTAAESEFIEKNPFILVLYDSGWPPIEYLGKH